MLIRRAQRLLNNKLITCRHTLAPVDAQIGLARIPALHLNPAITSRSSNRTRLSTHFSSSSYGQLELDDIENHTVKMMSQRFARPVLAAARRTAPRTTLRTYAAAAEANAKPPVPLFGLDGTYANALVCQTWFWKTVNTWKGSKRRTTEFTWARLHSQQINFVDIRSLTLGFRI